MAGRERATNDLPDDNAGDELVEDFDELIPDLGPDERDRDLMDGSWEDRYYRQEKRGIDWKSIQIGVALLVLLGLLLPLVLTVTG
ncbi:MAG: hypothetical protein ACKVVT_01170 [Dehalococcoidia bacterium]